MKKKEEKKYIYREWQSMKNHLRSFLKKEGGQEDLHQFRTGVKKLSAFFTLAESAEKEPDLLERFKPVRKVFKQAGKIRNAYMNLELGKNHLNGNSSFIQEQQQLMKSSVKHFKSHQDEYLAGIRKTGHRLSKRIRPVSNLHINLYYQTLLEQIAALLTKQRFGDELHECRKQLKTLIYNYKLIRPVLDMGFNEAYLEQVQAVIGDWHDNQLTIELFSRGTDNNDTAMANLKKQDKILKTQLNKLTKDFYTRATTVVDIPIEQIS
jgi:CHAD domain-containing protein